MTKFHCHYESLNVTRDAPAEVIRAAYRSLSQKHHPDKHMGDSDAAGTMARLNTAYSVLSDPDQRVLYDLQLRRQNTVRALLQSAGDYAISRNGALATAAVTGLFITIFVVLWQLRKDNQSMLRIEQSVTYSTDQAAAPAPEQWLTATEQTGVPALSGGAKAKPAGGGSVRIAGRPGAEPVAAERAQPAAATKAPTLPGAPSKISDYERLTAMLKSMGWGLHKLDSPPPALSTKQPAPAAAADPARIAQAADTSPAPAAPAQAAKPVAPPDTSRARAEMERPAAPDAARGDARPVAEAPRASAPAAASQPATGASPAPRPAVLADARGCATPAYPITAYRNGESGTVLLALLVGNDGKVIKSKVQKSSGSSELDLAARKAVATCQFKPLGNDGRTEPAWTRLSYVWTLD